MEDNRHSIILILLEMRKKYEPESLAREYIEAALTFLLSEEDEE